MLSLVLEIVNSVCLQLYKTKTEQTKFGLIANDISHRKNETYYLKKELENYHHIKQIQHKII